MWLYPDLRHMPRKIKKSPDKPGQPESENQHLRPVELVPAIIGTLTLNYYFCPFIQHFDHISFFRQKNRLQLFSSHSRSRFPLILPVIGMGTVLAQVVFI